MWVWCLHRWGTSAVTLYPCARSGAWYLKVPLTGTFDDLTSYDQRARRYILDTGNWGSVCCLGVYYIMHTFASTGGRPDRKDWLAGTGGSLVLRGAGQWFTTHLRYVDAQLTWNGIANREVNRTQSEIKFKTAVVKSFIFSSLIQESRTTCLIQSLTLKLFHT